MALFPRELIEKFFVRNTVAPPSAWGKPVGYALDYLESLEKDIEAFRSQLRVIRNQMEEIRSFHLRLREAELLNISLRRQVDELVETVKELEECRNISPPRRSLDLDA